MNLPLKVVASFTKKTISSNELHPEEKKLMENYEPRRKRDFIRGRYCAHQCLSKIDSRKPIGKDADGSPVWPGGITGSISHCSQMAGSIAARKEEYVSVGLDIELIGRIEREIWSILFTENERIFIAKKTSIEQKKYSTVIFSLKEAYFKMMHPITKIGLEPKHIEVDFGFDKINISSKTDSRYSNEDLTVDFKIMNDIVISYVLLKNSQVLNQLKKI
ncbi:4'-phosphopantetheinyl transferase superfamily protein [Ekhidna sp.]|uniref:4'-phosphopantetheinyl transferase family protein n=1 Tax=Ekhidna sp. TaxID=2608089 RepID=UPI003296CFC7